MTEYTEETVISMIQDFTRVTDTLDSISCAIENPEIAMPNFIPQCNNGMISDQLQRIIEYINKLRGESHGRG